MGTKLLAKLGTRAGLGAVGVAALLAAGVGVGAAAVSSPGTEETGSTSVVTPTTAAPATEPLPAAVVTREVAEPPAAETAEDTAVATVPTVTSSPAPPPTAEPEPEPVPAAVAPVEPESYDPEAPWTDSAGMTYVPAPDPTFEPLPGEPGYVPPGD